VKTDEGTIFAANSLVVDIVSEVKEERKVFSVVKNWTFVDFEVSMRDLPNDTIPVSNRKIL
jgi:hypothetical protein